MVQEGFVVRWSRKHYEAIWAKFASEIADVIVFPCKEVNVPWWSAFLSICTCWGLIGSKLQYLACGSRAINSASLQSHPASTGSLVTAASLPLSTSIVSLHKAKHIRVGPTQQKLWPVRVPTSGMISTGFCSDESRLSTSSTQQQASPRGEWGGSGCVCVGGNSLPSSSIQKVDRTLMAGRRRLRCSAKGCVCTPLTHAPTAVVPRRRVIMI